VTSRRRKDYEVVGSVKDTHLFCPSRIGLEEIGRVPHVRNSVRGPKTMGAALQSLFLNPQSNPYPQPGCFVGLRVEVCALSAL
jgi:hypothetical protein